jgi:protein tyrosine phosphatase (PTP) superfamily phosphohydrolase (DUF442 family)
MFRLDWLLAGRATRGKPRRYQFRRGQWARFGLLACISVFVSGCQSGPFSHCGSGSGLFGPCGFFNRTSARIFNRGNGCCGSGVVADGGVEIAAPASVVSAPVIPTYPPGTVPGSPPSAVSPLPGETPSELNSVPDSAVPRSRLGPAPTGNGASNATPGKTSYQTRRSDPGTRIARRPVTLPKTQVSTPEPTSRSAQALANPSAVASTGALDQDALDHLPPLDLPCEVTGPASNPPAAPAADRNAKPAAETGQKTGADRENSAPAADELDLASAAGPAGQPSPSASVGPGMKRFVAVDLKLAGGSAPSNEGLKWLVEKGYRTVLDLRESSAVPASFIADVTNLGLRYVALPISLKTIDRDHVDRFNFEVAAGEARPLFFFDSDGTRAGALWYIRRVATDRVDHQIARREAEELGLTDKGYWAAAASFITGLSAPRTTSISAGARPTSTDSPGSPTDTDTSLPPAQAREGSAPIPAAKPQDSNQSPASPAGAAPPNASLVTAGQNHQGTPPQSVSALAPYSDPLAWRPFAAMVITGLTLPLAYWTRTLPPAILAKARASLAGPAQRPRSLPHELGA